MTDIVKRLRAIDNMSVEDCFLQSYLFSYAADEIERLREALQRFAQTDPREVTILTNASMKDGEIERLIAAFEQAAHVDDDGTEYWLARDLRILLDYTKWENFEAVLERAIRTCETVGQSVSDHFQEVFPEVGKNPEGGRPARDFKLTRYACYLVTQNGDSRKKPVAYWYIGPIKVGTCHATVPRPSYRDRNHFRHLPKMVFNRLP